MDKYRINTEFDDVDLSQAIDLCQSQNTEIPLKDLLKLIIRTKNNGKILDRKSLNTYSQIFETIINFYLKKIGYSKPKEEKLKESEIKESEVESKKEEIKGADNPDPKIEKHYNRSRWIEDDSKEKGPERGDLFYIYREQFGAMDEDKYDISQNNHPIINELLGKNPKKGKQPQQQSQNKYNKNRNNNNKQASSKYITNTNKNYFMLITLSLYINKRKFIIDDDEYTIQSYQGDSDISNSNKSSKATPKTYVNKIFDIIEKNSEKLGSMQSIHQSCFLRFKHYCPKKDIFRNKTIKNCQGYGKKTISAILDFVKNSEQISKELKNSASEVN